MSEDRKGGTITYFYPRFNDNRKQRHDRVVCSIPTTLMHSEPNAFFRWEDTRLPRLWLLLRLRWAGELSDFEYNQTLDDSAAADTISRNPNKRMHFMHMQIFIWSLQLFGWKARFRKESRIWYLSRSNYPNRFIQFYFTWHVAVL